MKRRTLKQLLGLLTGLGIAITFNACSDFGSNLSSLSSSSNGLRTSFATPSNGHCFTTGGRAALVVCHNPGDEGIFYQTPTDRVAYNAQVVKLSPSEYETVVHTESRDSFDRHVARPGDSIRVGRQSGGYSYQMPAQTAFAIWGSTTDPLSTLYYGIGSPNGNAGGASGGGNPMMVAGRTWAGDGFHYMFFLGVSDGARFLADDWRHFLHLARTVDYVNFEILSNNAAGQKTWYPFNDSVPEYQRRPLALTDTSGNAIMSNFSADINSTQGLIGSVVQVGQRYYFFYTDHNPANRNEFLLYVRTSQDISQGDWSPPALVNSEVFGIGTIVRVAKAKGMDRWTVLYSCVSPETNASDLCVQYTENLGLTGPGSLASLKFFSDAGGHSPNYLGLSVSACNGTALRSQHSMMTDIFGNLDSPNGEESLARGGLITWMDLCSGAPYGAPMFRAGWDVHAADGVSDPSTSPPTPVSSSTPTPTPAPTPLPPQVPLPAGATSVTMLRFYNAQTGQHFYSASAAEGAASGATVEGPIFAFVGGTGVAGTAPIYRCLGQSVFISTHANCEGAKPLEGAYGSLYIVQGGPGRTPIYRLYNAASGDRLLSTSPSEGTSAGYALEGIIGFGL